MIEDDEIITKFNERMSNWFATTSKQRAESAAMFMMRDSHTMQRKDDSQYIDRKLDPQVQAANPRNYRQPAVVNLAGAYLRSITGMQINNGKSIEVASIDPNFDSVNDIGNDALDYILHEGGFKAARDLALEDAHVRGYGATVTTLDMAYVDLPCGRPHIERKFFTAFDLSKRAGDINRDMAWCAYADLVSDDSLKSYLKRNGKSEDISSADCWTAQYMENLNSDRLHLMGMVHNYFWCDYETVYKVQNPYKSQTVMLDRATKAKQGIENHIGRTTDALNIDIDADYWVLDKDDLKELDALMVTLTEVTGVKIDKLERAPMDARVYRRAEIVGDTVVKKSNSFTQRGHPMNFITGYFDEVEGYHYGLMRPMSQVQMLLNEMVTAAHSYAHRAEVGGTIGISGAGDGLEELVDAVRQKTSIIPFPTGATISSLGSPDTAQAMLGLIDLYVKMLPSVAGVSPEIMAQLSTKDMGEGLMQSMMQQMNISLLHSQNGMDSYLLNQGYIGIDLARSMASVGDLGRIRAVAPRHGEEEYKRFAKQNFAKNYSARISEKSDSEEKRTRDFRLLVEGVQMFSEAKRDMFAPVVLENMPIDSEQKSQLKDAMQPPQQNLQISEMDIRRQNAEISMMEAQAAQLAAQAQKEQAQAALAQRDGVTNIDKSVSEIDKNKAQTQKIISEINQPQLIG
jgi:hypothetical protein